LDESMIELLGSSTEEGAHAGFAEGKLVARGDDPVSVATEVVAALVDEDVEAVTALAGRGVDAGERERLRGALAAVAPDADVQVHEGGQDSHLYLLSVE